jgi:serine/threonine-protein phosphatase 2A regulatory subunit B'
MKLIQTVKRRMGNEDKKTTTARTGAAGSGGTGGGASSDASAKSKAAAPAASGTRAVTAKPATESSSFAAMPKLREAPPAERIELFKKKIELCLVVFDFHNDNNQKEKEAKRQTLLEIVEYVNNTRNCFNESLMHDVVTMVGVNIFRALQTRNKDPLAFSDPEDDEPSLERAWPHLQIVYEFFLRFVVSNDVDPKIAKRFVDQNFMLKLLELFDSEDPRERDYLKTILHRIYGKFMALRSFIRRAIQHVFFKVIYESETHNGVGELLEILGSIINGFALPLKEEHKDFLIRALIPLHKVKSLASFYQQLSYCMAQYVEKDPRLAYDIIMSMLRYWPVSITSKQVLFLNELEETLELTQPPEFHRMQHVLFRRLALCITCPHFQVAERTLFFWNTDYIVKLINANRHELFPIIIGALYRNSKHHWNSAVHGLTFNVLKLLMEADPQLFDECSAKHRSDEEEEVGREQARAQKWKALQDMHDAKHNAA